LVKFQNVKNTKRSTTKKLQNGQSPKNLQNVKNVIMAATIKML